jgi:hypothetical protein
MVTKKIKRILKEGFTVWAETSPKSVQDRIQVNVSIGNTTGPEDEFTVCLWFENLLEHASVLNYHDGVHPNNERLIRVWNMERDNWDNYSALDWWNTLDSDGKEDIIYKEIEETAKEAIENDWYSMQERGNIGDIAQYSPIEQLVILDTLRDWVNDKQQEIQRQLSSIAA